MRSIHRAVPVGVRLLGLTIISQNPSAWAQPNRSNQQAQTSAPASPVDPLNRETPYGSIMGLLKAAGQNNHELVSKMVTALLTLAGCL